jgi:predicted site-specific integrase-resolvase
MTKNKTLIRVSNYAKKLNVSTTWVYRLIKEGSVKCEIIDGIKFIVVWEEKEHR